MTNLPARQNDINLPVLANPDEFIEIVKENFQFINFTFERIKWPTGGFTVFKVTDESGQETTVNELIGVILYYHPMNVYYEGRYTGEKRPPDCVSYDGRTSVSGLDCLSCPKNQYGPNGEAKECKNVYRIYLLREGESLPVLITLPPTSRKPFENYLKFLVQKALRRYYGVVTRIGLTTQKNREGIEYSKAVFSKIADLTPEETKALKQYVEVLKPMFSTVTATSEDYYVPNGDDEEEVPF